MPAVPYPARPWGDACAAEAPEPLTPRGFPADDPRGVDASFVSRLERLDQGAWRELVLTHRRMVRGVVAARLGYGPELEEATQLVFVTAAQMVLGHRVTLHGDASGLRAWLAAIAVRVSLRAVRERRRSPLADERDGVLATTELDTESRHVLERVQRVLNTLPERLATPWLLRHLERLSLLEIASTTGSSLATVKRRLVQAEQAFTGAARRDPVLADFLELGGAR